MANKTKEVDNLLTRIITELKANKYPSVRDSVELEALQWNYKEYTKKNMANDLGLRSRVKVNSSTDFEFIPQEFLTALLHQSPIGEFDVESYITTIEAYLERKITVAKVFGERYRKQRNDVSWQKSFFYADLVEFARAENNDLSLTHDDSSISNNVFQLLEDVTKNWKEQQIIDRHPCVKKDQLKKLKLRISNEIKSGSLKKGLISRGTFQSAHAKMKKLHFFLS